MFTICDDATPNSPLPIFARLLAECDELAELKGMLDEGHTIAFMFAHASTKTGGNRTILGYCAFPAVMGRLRSMFEWLLEERLGYFPTWLLVLDMGFWEVADETTREALLLHELLHAGQAVDQYGTPKVNRQTGEPVPAIKPHDLEEFGAVVRRYGAWKSDVAEFLAASR